jgi:hypothetical protein
MTAGSLNKNGVKELNDDIISGLILLAAEILSLPLGIDGKSMITFKGLEEIEGRQVLDTANNLWTV